MKAVLTLYDLLRLAYPRSSLQWLSALPPENVAVNWVVLAIADVQTGDLLISPAESVTQELLYEAERRGACGVILVGGSSAVPSAAKERLEMLPLPVVLLSGDENPRVIQRLLLTLLVNQRLGLVERGYRLHLQFTQLSAEGAGLPGLARAAMDITGRGVIIQDKRGSILAEQVSPALESIWTDVLTQIGTSITLPEVMRDRKQAGQQGGAVLQEIPGGLIRLIKPITVGGVARGYLSLVGLAGEIDELDYLVAEQGAVVCAIEMRHSKAMREVEKRLQVDLLTALLHEDFSPRDAALWAQNLGLDLAQAHVALRFAWSRPTSSREPPSRRRLETLVNGEVSRLGLKVILSAMGNEVVCFCQVPPRQAGYPSRRPEIALELGKAVLRKGKEEHPDTPVCCGVGLEALSLRDWQTSFRQAGQALELARRLKSDQVMYFSDLSVYRLLLQIEHSPELTAFQEETLGALLAQENSLELLRTLESYFAHNGNISQTADALFIHRNTLIYRLERIANILGQDLDNPETRLALQLALHIHRMK